MKLHQAQEIAVRVAALLEPACERVVIAGSVRREKAHVGDIELVALPRFQVDLWGAPIYRQALELDDLLRQLVKDGAVEWDMAQKRNGPLWKRLLVREGDGVAIDLFLCDHRNWGNTLAIRTGNAHFSEQMMVAAQRNGVRQQEGYLWRVDAASHKLDKEARRICCPTEEDFFAAIGLEWIAPVNRNDETAQQVRAGQWRRKAAKKGERYARF